MTNVLNMQWTISSSYTFTFAVKEVKHGDTPAASPSSLSNGSATVTAKQSTNITPGPEGTYWWEFSDSKVICDYHFPAGQPPQLIHVYLTPGDNRVQVSFDGSTWYSDKVLLSPTSHSTTEFVTCYIRDTPKG